jgi:hypothetical protein
MKWFFAISLLALSAGIQYWAIQKRSARVCRSASELSMQADRMRGWLSDSLRDPFLYGRVFRGHTGAVIEETLQRARWISSETSGSRLAPDAQAAFQKLGLAAGSEEKLAAALEGLAKLAPSLRCESRVPAGEDGQLHFRVGEASRAWEGEKQEAVLAKLSFEQDKLIYCKGDELLRGLQKVVATREARCKGEKLPPKLAASCKEKSEALDGEIADLEKQKDFNMRKLRQKWPEPVLKELECGQPS